MHRRLIFLSCGQRTEEEKDLGRAVAATIDSHNGGFCAFSAERAHSADELASHILNQLRTCAGFLGIMHPRGAVVYFGGKQEQLPRGSVWIHQEIAMIKFRSFLEGRAVPMRIYQHGRILREGIIDTLIVNPIPFERSEELIDDVGSWLSGDDFREHPAESQRATLFHRRTQSLTADHWLMLEIILAHTHHSATRVTAMEIVEDFLATRGQSWDDKTTAAHARRTLDELRTKRVIGHEEAGQWQIRPTWIKPEWRDLITTALGTKVDARRE